MLITSIHLVKISFRFAYYMLQEVFGSHYCIPRIPSFDKFVMAKAFINTDFESLLKPGVIKISDRLPLEKMMPYFFVMPGQLSRLTWIEFKL
jgi:hypothetical protein